MELFLRMKLDVSTVVVLLKTLMFGSPPTSCLLLPPRAVVAMLPTLE